MLIFHSYVSLPEGKSAKNMEIFNTESLSLSV